MTSKRIDLGEYVVTIYHNEQKELLEVKVFDELGDIIEAIIINSYDEEEDEETDENNHPNFNLN
jgi:hypothetical protein